MFKRSRKRISLSILGSLVFLFVITLSVILLASYQQIQRKSSEILQDYIERYSLEQEREKAGDLEPRKLKDNPPPNRKQDYQLSTFYSVAFAEDGSVLKVDSGTKEVYGKEYLIGMGQKILAEKEKAGRIETLLFCVVRRDGYTLVAFMDNTVTDNTMHTLLMNFLVVGGVAIIVLFFISLFLSKQIIRPLEENDQRQKQFVSDASHELKTPVTVISTNAEILSRELGENEWLSNIQYESERMGELIKQLLDLSTAESREVQVEHIDFTRIVTGEILAFESLAFEKGIIIQSNIEEDILLTGNPAQLTQLVSILLDNAVCYSTDNRIDVFLKRQGYTAVLSFVNTGEDIPIEKQEQIFDRFYRVDEARNGGGQHYGLGLPIAKTVAEKHGGSIRVSCHGGKICFSVSLPVN